MLKLPTKAHCLLIDVIPAGKDDWQANYGCYSDADIWHTLSWKESKSVCHFEGINDNICSDNKSWTFKRKLESAETHVHGVYPVFRNIFKEIGVDINKHECFRT